MTMQQEARMTEQELERLEALAEAATQEPWELHGTVVVYSPTCCRKVAEADEPDAAFIAAARDAVPALVEVAKAARRVVNADNDRDQAAAIVLLRRALDGGGA